MSDEPGEPDEPNVGILNSSTKKPVSRLTHRFSIKHYYQIILCCLDYPDICHLRKDSARTMIKAAFRYFL